MNETWLQYETISGILQIESICTKILPNKQICKYIQYTNITQDALKDPLWIFMKDNIFFHNCFLILELIIHFIHIIKKDRILFNIETSLGKELFIKT